MAASFNKPGRKPGRFPAGCFFGSFALIGGGLLFPFLILPLKNIRDAESWPAVPCEILESSVGEHSGSEGGSTYSVDVRYAYVVDDVKHTSDRYRFMGGSSSGREAKAAIVADLPPGARTVCYVDPFDPTSAVLDRGFTAELWIGCVPGVFLLVGVGGIVGTVVARRRAKAGPEIRKGVGLPSVPAGSVAGDTLILPSRSTPMVKFVAIAAFAVIWNGFVAFFAFSVYGPGGDGCGKVFAVPFILVGLGTLAGAGYFFLGLFNPRTTVVVSPATPRAGDVLEFRWKTEGRVERVGPFRITLEGREEARYRRGTKTQTDKEVFHTFEIAKGKGGPELCEGFVMVPIPSDTMHTFDAPNNKILWSIRVKGEVARWPDIDEEFALPILPSAAGEDPA